MTEPDEDKRLKQAAKDPGYLNLSAFYGEPFGRSSTDVRRR